MNLTEQEIKQIFLEDDILPLGKFETLPVTHELDGLPNSYPYVSLIKDGIDYETMLSESKVHMDTVGFNYVKPRIKEINSKVNEDILRDVLGSVGFYKGSYQSFSLRKIGTADLEDWVLPATRKFFNSLPIKTFRQQYAVAYPGWNTQLHRDHKDFKTHGFRAMVPLSADVYMGYEDANGSNIVFRLKRGGMYFVNIAMMHRGFNESKDVERVNLIMQMENDSLVVNSTPLTPINSEQLLKLPEYATNYQSWRFGHEL